MTGRKKDWTLTKAAFDKLLAQLHPDVECAQHQYEVIHKGLIRFFEYNSCSASAELADETINRVARKLLEGEVIQAGKVAAYFRGVARHVLQEYWRSPEAGFLSIEEALLPPHLHHNPDELMDDLATQCAQEHRLECLERCLEKWPPETRHLLFAYDKGKGKGAEGIANHKRLADAFGVSLANLRLRTHRLRKKLEACVVSCCENPAK